MLPNNNVVIDTCLRVLGGYQPEVALAMLDGAVATAEVVSPAEHALVEIARLYLNGAVDSAAQQIPLVMSLCVTPLERAAANIWNARLHSKRNNLTQAKQILEGVCSQCDGMPTEWHMVSMVSHWRLGLLEFNDGDMQQARKLYRMARSFARSMGLVREEAMMDSDIATVYLEIHDLLRAVELFNRSANALAEIGEHYIAGKIRINIATALQRQGHHAEAARAYEDVMRRSFNAYEPHVQFTCTMNLALCYKNMQQYEKAESVYSQLSGQDLLQFGAEAHARLRYAIADVRFRRGDYDSTLAECALAQSALGDASAALFLEIESLRSEAMWNIGRTDEAIDRMSMVFTEALRLDHRRMLLTVSSTFSTWLAQVGRYEEAYRVVCERTAIIDRARATDEERAATVASMRNAIEQERLVMKAIDDQRRSILSNVLPTHVANRLMEGETAIAEQRESVAVMFIDIVNFSRLATTLPAKELVASLEHLFRDFDNVMDRHRCEKIKTIGDSYMATGGTHDEDHVAQRRRTITAAVDILRLVANRSDGLRVRIGIHAGPAVVGVMGGKRMTYDVWGDTVNVAARMESTGEPGRIQASEAVVAGVDAAFLAQIGARVTPRGIIAPKGIAPLSTVWIDGE